MTVAFKWRPFGAGAFDEAKAGRKPLLLVLDAPARFDADALARLARERFVAVLAERHERPDVCERYKGPAGVLVLGWDGEVVAAPARDEPQPLADELAAAADAYRPDASRACADSGQIWTGAVGAPQMAALDSDFPRRAVEQAKSAPPESSAALDALFLAAAEWGDADAARAAGERLDGLLTRHYDEKAGRLVERGGQGALARHAGLARLLADGAAALGGARYAEAAGRLAELLLEERRDAATGSFAHAPGAPAYADENAETAIALLRAAPFGRSAELISAAESALLFLERSLYDPMLGMLHRRSDDGSALVYNLLGDNAATALAFTEAYLRTGRKPYRDFADALVRHMFQELWDRDRGGFLDRAAADSDVAPMRSARAPGALNAVALEALWRLHETKGNPNYRRWLDWGLRALIPSSGGAEAAALARVQVMLERGRMDLELVGRVGEAKADALLAEIHRHYAPRRIVSFVDPDDQDYILAHKLVSRGGAQSPPRIFGCIDLRPVADAGEPSEVAAVIAAVRKR